MEIYIVKRVLSYVGCLAAVFIGGLAWLIMLYRGYIARHFALTDSQGKDQILLYSTFSPLLYVFICFIYVLSRTKEYFTSTTTVIECFWEKRINFRSAHQKAEILPQATIIHSFNFQLH